jgi:hypothetical protein
MPVLTVKNIAGHTSTGLKKIIGGAKMFDKIWNILARSIMPYPTAPCNTICHPISNKKIYNEYKEAKQAFVNKVNSEAIQIEHVTDWFDAALDYYGNYQNIPPEIFDQDRLN